MSSGTPEPKSVRYQAKFTKITLEIEWIRDLRRYALSKNGRELGAKKFDPHQELPEIAQAAGDDVSLAQDNASPNVGARR
jgi:hypothetical protein